MRSTLLVIHILAAGAWIGASATFLFATPKLRKAGHESGASLMSVYQSMGRMYYPPAAVLILVTGFWLVIDSSVYGFEDSFVAVGIVAVVAGAFLGIRIFGPLASRIQGAHTSRDETALNAGYRRFMRFGVLDVAILAFAVVAMVTKLAM